MKEVYISPDLQGEIRDVPIPVPKSGEVLIKVAVTGLNPKDWKMPVFVNQALNSGDDLAGVIEAVGDGVYEFKPGDRVAAMHQIGTGHGSFAEYAITPAATIPMNGLVAAFGLYHVLGLPAPWSSGNKHNTPVVVHGAGTAIGAFAVKLARAANIHPIIATAGNSSHLVRGFLDPEQGDALIDYRQPQEKLVASIQSAITKAGKGPAWHGLDSATNQDGAPEYTGVLKEVLGTQVDLTGAERKPFIATVQMGSKLTGSVDGGDINVMLAHTGTKDQQCLAYTVTRLFGYGLANGWLTGHPTEVVEGGLGAVGDALKKVRDNKVFGKKLVVQIGPE
ncbi:hypothetical protein ACHAPJ_012959 [Fusarium lateritium]